MRLLVTLPVAALLLIASPLRAQHLGARQQWQPEISDTDPRLQQPVTVEILGRAAVPALKLLSDATGVTLTVAPENLGTVGERKLTIISRGLTLKAIMVQLPNALQECHWDIDTSGDEPVYLLHRNAGVEGAAQAEQKRRKERARQREIDWEECEPLIAAEPPTDPELLSEVSLRTPRGPNLAAIQQALAADTGLSVISDFFENGPAPSAPKGPHAGIPLWRVLDVLCGVPGPESAPAPRQPRGRPHAMEPELEWHKGGRCLVFRHVNWYALARIEIPESIIQACRDRLRIQGYFTLKDLVELAILLRERGLSSGHFPNDLRRAGISGTLTADTWAYVLYDSLSPEQLARASTGAGLPFSELSEGQQAWVYHEAGSQPELLGASQAEFSILRASESPQTIRGRPWRRIEVELEFPGACIPAVIMAAAEEATAED